MKKGDLVISISEEDHLLRLAPKSTWKNPGVVIRGVYEGRLLLVNALTGKNIATELTPVVDIMIAGRIIKEVPIKYLDRVVR
jgi:hypothetical protein